MPYIRQDKRRVLANTMDPSSPGDLNYCITLLIRRYLRHVGTSYGSLNAAMGVLSCAGHEIYRRVVARYEDLKITQNGDVF